MLLSNAEKCKRRREKIRNDKDMYKQHLQKDKQRKREARARRRKSMTKTELDEHRAFERNRIRNLRRAKQNGGKTESQTRDDSTGTSDHPDRETPYKTVQALGKAVKRVQQSLPFSPRKRKRVAAEVAKSAGLKIAFNFPVKNKGRPGLDPQNVEKVTSFFLKDDISWQAPGRKDRDYPNEK